MSDADVCTPVRAPLPTWQWIAGLVALALFAQKLVHDWPLGLAANSLWACHMGNLALGLGLLLRQPWLQRLGVYWVLAGLPFWLIDVAATGTTNTPSVLSHAGGCAVAGLVLSCRCWRGQRRDPWVAWAGFLLLQALSRWLTPPPLNVNLAHAVHGSAQAVFASHAAYLAFMAVVAAGVLLAMHSGIETFRRRRA